MKENEILENILRIREELGITTLPTYRQLYDRHIYSGALMKLGGLENIAKMTGIPMFGKVTKRKSKIQNKSKDEIVKSILELKESLHLDHLPTVVQCEKHGITQNDIKKAGGLRKISQSCGIRLKDRNGVNSSMTVRPSRAFEIDRSARKKGPALRRCAESRYLSDTCGTD